MVDSPGPRRFETTQWSLVRAAQDDPVSQSRARAAMEELCRAYWYPLYAFVRSRGYSPEDSQDLTQAFFTRIIETGGLATADRNRGRFRSYLLGALKHFLSNEWHRDRALKRGGQMTIVEWDNVDPEGRYSAATGSRSNSDYLFDREWALETLSAALGTLRREMVESGKNDQFEALKGSLTMEGETPRHEIASRLKISEGAVKVAIHRLRQRYRELLRSAIAATVSSEADLDDEMRYLVTVLRGE